MSRSGKITLAFGDGDHVFALKIGQLEELQEKTGAGPWYIQWAAQMAVLAEQANMAPPKDLNAAYITETIRLGLIGGGMEAIAAMKLVRRYVSEGSLSTHVVLAYAILGAALQGVEEDMSEKPQAGEEMTTPSREDASDLPASSEPELPLD